MKGKSKLSRKWQQKTVISSEFPKKTLHAQTREVGNGDVKWQPGIVMLTVKERVADWWIKYQQGWQN